MKGQNDGIVNESNIVDAYNEVEYQYLNECQRNFVSQLNSNVKEETVIYATQVGGRGYKADITLEIIEKDVSVSVKKGGGNSVHQEKTAYFIKYCMTELDMTEEEKEALLLYLYGDGTMDGDSAAEERLSGDDLNQYFSDEIITVQKFLNRNTRNLIERFLVYGRLGREDDIKADYLFHGSAIKGVWCPFDYTSIDYIVSLATKDNAALSIGPLSLQVWNRNLKVKPNLEDRRHSIQVKWPSCKNDVIEINDFYLENKSKRSKEQRIIGDNSQGFRNQSSIATELNGSRYRELSTNLKSMIKIMFPIVANTDLIEVEEIKSQQLKPKMTIIVNGIRKNVSIKMGVGNGMHQEPTSSFIEFAKKQLGMTSAEEIALLKVLYGDGTIDGKSDAKDRLSTKGIKNIYKQELELIRLFLDRNRKEIIERVLIYGSEGGENNVKSNFLYYGTPQNGKCIPYPDTIEYLCDQENSISALLPLGKVTMQIWNANLQAKPDKEYKRHSVQFKWGSMKNTINSIYEHLEMSKKGKYEGDWEEFELVGKLNRNRNSDSELWNGICSVLDIANIDNVYAVKTSNTKYSNLVERNVLPKADVYLVEANFSHQFMLEHIFWIDEDMIEHLQYSIIEGSGISCKRPDSKSFTYCKLSRNAFTKLFDDKELGAGISLFVTEKEIELNLKVIEEWGCSLEEFTSYFVGRLSQNYCCDLEYYKTVKQYAINEIKERTKRNKEIREIIFMGKDIFEEPFSASFIYTGGNVYKNYIPDFSITTGSGRHNGTYTVVFKP